MNRDILDLLVLLNEEFNRLYVSASSNENIESLHNIFIQVPITKLLNDMEFNYNIN